MKPLKITQFGNPILRQQARELSKEEILSAEIKALLSDMRELLKKKKLGVGLAAPQVGEQASVAIIEIQKTKLRPSVEEKSLVIINPKITQVLGRKTQLWEGCISSGNGEAGLFAKVPRYKKIEIDYFDEQGKQRRELFDGLVAHVIQHEVDHLNGVLFVDKVKDSTTFMTYAEYKKMKKTL
jgi:peptide deformylase